LRQQQAPPGGAVAIIGADYRVVARNQQEESVAGTLANKALIEQSRQYGEGNLRIISREGQPTYSAYSRSAQTGLMAALGLPEEQVDGTVRRILWTLAAAWLVVLTLGGVLGTLLGGVIVRALSSASDAAMALARGGAVSPPPSRIAEIDALASALRQAS